jgi:hypothetical protein
MAAWLARYIVRSKTIILNEAYIYIYAYYIFLIIIFLAFKIKHFIASNKFVCIFF